jgi:hypothetical protein
MRVGLVVLAVLMLLVGAVWIGQGLGYIKGSFMTGDMHWFWIGVVVAALGVIVAALTLLTRPRPRGTGEAK